MVLFQKLMDEKEEKGAKILKLNNENNKTAEGEKVIQNEKTRSSRLKNKMKMEKDKKRILMKEWVLTNGFYPSNKLKNDFCEEIGVAIGQLNNFLIYKRRKIN